MRVTVVPIVVRVLWTVPKGMEKGLEELKIKGWIDTIQTTVLLNSVIIVKKVQEIWGGLLSLADSSERPPAKAKSKMIKK